MSKSEPRRNQKVYTRSMSSERYRPPAPLAKPEEIWDRIETLLPGDTPQASAAEKPKEARRKRGAARRRARRLRWRRALDVIAIVMWSLIVVKLFIGDLDRAVLASLAPGAVWVLDLRWFLVLVVAALLLLLLNGRTLGLSLAYIAGFPLVVLFWKIPKVLVERRSPVFAIGFASLTANFAARTRPFIYAITLETLCALIIVISSTSWLVEVAIATFAIVLTWWLVVMAIDMFRSEAILRAQERFIRWVLDHEIVERFVTPEQPDQLSLKGWKAEDAQKYRDRAGMALIARQALNYWAYAVSQYRRGPWVVIFNVVVVVGMIFQIIVAFAFINYGIYSIDPGQYASVGSPDAATYLYYSAAGSYFGEINALSPVGTWATVAKLANGIVGMIGVSTIVTSFLLGLRSARVEAGSAGAIKILNQKAEDVRGLMESQYQMALDELETRLEGIGWGALGILRWLAAKSENAHLTASPSKGSKA